MHLQIIFQASVAFAVWFFALGTIKAFECLSPGGRFIYFWSQLKCKEMVLWWVYFFFLIKAISPWNSRMEIVTHQPSKNKKKKRGLFMFLGGFISTWEQRACAFNVAHESQMLRPLIAQKKSSVTCWWRSTLNQQIFGVPELLIPILVQKSAWWRGQFAIFWGLLR